MACLISASSSLPFFGVALTMLNMALYECSIIWYSARFAVFGDTALRLMNEPMMMQKLFFDVMDSSRPS